MVLHSRKAIEIVYLRAFREIQLKELSEWNYQRSKNPTKSVI